MNKNRSLYLGLALLMPASFLMADNCSSNCDSGVSSSCDTSASCDTSCSTSCSTGCSTSCDSSNSCTNPCGSCVTTYIPRAQNADTVFWEFFSDQSGHKPDQDCFNGGLQLNVQYQQSFRGHDIARTLFGKSTLVFEGSNYYGADRTAGALIADNFGLGPDFKGTMTLNPRIRNVNVNFGGYFAFDEWVQGLWLSSSFTFAHQSRDLNACFTTPTYGEDDQTAANFPAGYVSTTEATGAKTIKEALSGDFTFGDMATKWKFGRFSFCDMTTNKVAAVDFNFGYDFWNCEDYHFGAFLRVSAPTGTKIDASYARNVFAPVVGNGHHVEVGGGITGRWQLWNCDEDQSLTAYLDGYVTHLFSNCQVRSFDLKTTNSHCLSRYMLLKELTPNDAEDFSYGGSLINAINWATRNADVSISVKGDATLRLIYRHNNWDLGFGYNIYGHSRDSLCVKTKYSPCSAVDTTKTYGIMSNEGNYYSLDGSTFDADNTLNSTATKGTGNTPEAGANIYNVVIDSNRTPIVDNPEAITGTPWYDVTGIYVTTVNQSTPAIALDSTTDLDINSGKSPAQLIQKGFLTTNYTWKDCDWTPYLGAGVEVEGGSKFYHLKQWGVTLRGGFSF